MHKLKRTFIYMILSIFTIVSIFPFIWMIVSATNKSSEVTKGRLLPGTHLVENFQNLINTVDLVPALTNSAIISIATTVLSLIIASLAGYGFEIYRSKAKDVVFTILLLSMMIPFAALMIPLFRMFGTISEIAPVIG